MNNPMFVSNLVVRDDNEVRRPVEPEERSIAELEKKRDLETQTFSHTEKEGRITSLEGTRHDNSSKEEQFEENENGHGVSSSQSFEPYNVHDYSSDGGTSKKRVRKNLPKEVVMVLEETFQQDNHPSLQTKQQLATQLNIELKRVSKWFDNRRSKRRHFEGPNANLQAARWTRKPRRTSEEEFGQSPRSSRRSSRPKNESWDLDQSLIVHALENINSVPGPQVKENVHEELEDWLEYVRTKKTKTSAEEFQRFKLEVQRLFDSVLYHAELNLWQGDNHWVSSNISIVTFSFRVPENAGHQGQDIVVQCTYDSRVTGRSNLGNQMSLERISFTIMGRSKDAYTIGVKAVGPSQYLESGTRDSLITHSAWGDIGRLQGELGTSLSEPELMAFLMFCSQFPTHQRWFSICMKDYMFPDQDENYYSEIEVSS